MKLYFGRLLGPIFNLQTSFLPSDTSPTPAHSPHSTILSNTIFFHKPQDTTGNPS